MCIIVNVECKQLRSLNEGKMYVKYLTECITYLSWHSRISVGLQCRRIFEHTELPLNFYQVKLMRGTEKKIFPLISST